MAEEKLQLKDQRTPEEAQSIIVMTGLVNAYEPDASVGKNNSLSWFSMPKASTVVNCVICSAFLIWVYVYKIKKKDTD